MLEELHVRNYALIDNLKIRFQSGFNVLTGETGAGKSILIDALSLVLGGKGRVESVRQGEKEAQVSAVFRIRETPDLAECLGKYNIQTENQTLVLGRTLRVNGRGSASIQAIPVPLTALAELAMLIVDIHGQHEHQSLFQISTHRKLLDRFVGIEDQVQTFTRLFLDHANLGKHIEDTKKEHDTLIREMDFLEHAVSEIEAAQLKELEDDQLLQRRKVLASHEDLQLSLEQTLESSSESRGGSLALIRQSIQFLQKASLLDDYYKPLAERLQSTFYEIEDIIDDVRKKHDKASFDAAELQSVEDRLKLIENLEKKYGAASIKDLLAFADKSRQRLKGFDELDQKQKQLEMERESLQAKLKEGSVVISQKRRAGSSDLEQKVQQHLHSLGMEGALFSVALEGKQGGKGQKVLGPYGADDIEFLLSANRGEHPKALKSVASGGEISRVMLALKTVLSQSDPVQTMIFDEVDSGIGGEVARSVGVHLYGLSKQKQVFCVTHLASIAVFADNHLKVAKKQDNGRIITYAQRIDGDERTREVARMLAGNEDDGASLKHASRLLEESRNNIWQKYNS